MSRSGDSPATPSPCPSGGRHSHPPVRSSGHRPCRRCTSSREAENARTRPRAGGDCRLLMTIAWSWRRVDRRPQGSVDTVTAAAQPTEWGLHEPAERLAERLLAEACRRSRAITALAGRLELETSPRLFDWLDHIAAPVEPAELTEVGYVDGHRTVRGVWRHPGAQLPAVVPQPSYTVALRVDDCAAFAAAYASDRGVDGSPMAGLRRTVVTDEGTALVAVERRS